VTREDFLATVNARRGHFLYESGYHSDLWFDLETLCREPLRLKRYAAELAAKISVWQPDVICGPLIEGALLGWEVASELRCDFTYTTRVADTARGGLFAVEYQLPPVLRAVVSRRRVVIVNDVISAGSAVRGTLQSLRSAGAEVAGVGSLAVLGSSFPAYAAQQNLALQSLIELPENTLWEPAECPLCAAAVVLEKLATH
jgi:orotate phosphoribosyltransferase